MRGATATNRPCSWVNGRFAAEAVVQQEADRHVLETRHHGCEP